MSWADAYIDRLRAGETVSFRPRGNSMTPRIQSGQLVTVAPIDASTPLATGDVVLVTVAGRQYLHLISATQGERVQISNNHGHVNGWAQRTKVHGKMLSVAP